MKTTVIHVFCFFVFGDELILIVMSTTNCFGSHVYRRSLEYLLLLLLAKAVRFSGTVVYFLLALFNCYHLLI